jgi:hypothetical protein
MRSPKLRGGSTRNWYRYYAGYSERFVEDALDVTISDASDVVLDPWNGSGTTTKVALKMKVGRLATNVIDDGSALHLLPKSRP